MTTNNKNILKKFTSFGKIFGILLVIIGLYYILHYGFSNFDHVLYEFMSKSGIFGPILFIMFQALQVIVPILPGGLSLSVGVLAFGSTLGFLYNYLGITIGSIASFCLIRRFGKRLLQNIVSEKNYKKIMHYLENKKNFTYFFIFAILFPIAPDDLLCMVAALTKMRLRTFSLIIILCKPFSIFAYGYVLTALLQHL
ncbi:TVP38/TMEM64 family protein [Enterococcus canintestini]|uniref:TVP38/TMEM64 family protein n=1 Tax=Enterococcus canintestini TaxID=317010 RepID=UPI002891A3C8|nr:TVP38/TMEM64 family protein [Enterococcus canintestini]MDT2740615.1 TVP38/TMEM64 family protein [Enterococcus canintestini]